CYLSESSESVHDAPLDVIFRRVDRIVELYGPGVGVQVTGGDPTLREREELVAIVRRISGRRLRPSLLTNGIRATRELLAELAGEGLFDVAFHVDTTQRRRRFPTEADLNEVRREYIERARGLGIAVIFNTTVHAGNLEEIPDLVRFFLRNSDVVGMASFQAQAVTGRGEWRVRDPAVTPAAIAERIRRGVGLPRASRATPPVGHPDCNRGVMLATAGGRAVDLLTNRPLYERFLQEFRHVPFDRRDVNHTTRKVLATALRDPFWLLRGGKFLAGKLWSLRRGPLVRKRDGKITLFIPHIIGARALAPHPVRHCPCLV